MFYSAIVEILRTRKTDALDHQGDPSFWVVVPCKDQGWAIHFALVRPDSGPFSKIIGALTNSPVSHAEWEATDFSPSEMVVRAELKLDLPYDLEEILRKAINPNDVHHTEGKEFCSGMVYEIIKPDWPNLTPYPYPGLLMNQSASMLDVQLPKFAAHDIQIGQDELDFLTRAHDDGKIATGTFQEACGCLSL